MSPKLSRLSEIEFVLLVQTVVCCVSSTQIRPDLVDLRISDLTWTLDWVSVLAPSEISDDQKLRLSLRSRSDLRSEASDQTQIWPVWSLPPLFRVNSRPYFWVKIDLVFTLNGGGKGQTDQKWSKNGRFSNRAIFARFGKIDHFKMSYFEPNRLTALDLGSKIGYFWPADLVKSRCRRSQSYGKFLGFWWFWRQVAASYPGILTGFG